MSWTVHHGRSELVLPRLGPFGSCVTDPPYGLSFMNRAWDSPDNVAFRPEFWRVVFDALKPGAYLVAFGGTRKFHRLMVAIEDAGFELRDTLCWLYGQGMPKSHNVSKALDKASGAEREVVGQGTSGSTAGMQALGPSGIKGGAYDITAPATDAAKQWDGYGTALSPSWEPIVLARKPLTGTVAANVLEHGVGGLNIDGCRLAGEGGGTHCSNRDEHGKCRGHKNAGRSTSGETFHGPDYAAGRWPPNVCLDEAAAAMLDAQSGDRRNGGQNATSNRSSTGVCYSPADGGEPSRFAGDTGGASRFFYCPKASTAERNRGLGDEQNTHPTVKPVALVRWLVRLVTPPGETVVDPFFGSGTTGVAAVLEGYGVVGIEEAAEAVRIAKLRCNHVEANPAEVADVEPAKTRQPELF